MLINDFILALGAVFFCIFLNFLPPIVNDLTLFSDFNYSKFYYINRFYCSSCLILLSFSTLVSCIILLVCSIALLGCTLDTTAGDGAATLFFFRCFNSFSKLFITRWFVSLFSYIKFFYFSVDYRTSCSHSILWFCCSKASFNA